MIRLVGVILIGITLIYGIKHYLEAKGKEGGKAPLSGAELIAERAGEIARGMSDEELVGQLLVAGFSGKEPDYYIQRMIQLRHFGGVILFSRNVESGEQVGALAASLQKLAAAGGTLPLWICVDEEGGPVRRLQGIIEGETDPAELARLQDAAFAERMAEAVGQQLMELGINVNFAPVADIGFPGGIMTQRALGSDGAKVSTMAAALIRGYHQGGVVTCAKHFPGLGRAMTDPHGEPVLIDATREELTEDLAPFAASIADGSEMVMVSHGKYPAYDQEEIASLSSNIQKGLLRQELGFTGIIVIDDLEMGAALAKGQLAEVALQAVLAGGDLLLVCHTPELQAAAFDGLLQGLQDGRISRERLEESAVRNISAKISMGLIPLE